MSNQSELGTEVERIVDETHVGTACIPIPNQKLHFNPSQKRWDFFLITWPSIWHTQQKVSWRVNVLLCNSMKRLPTLVDGVLAVDGVLVIDLKFAKVLVNYKCFVTPASFLVTFCFFSLELENYEENARHLSLLYPPICALWLVFPL